jgi:hypothetical protein
VHQTPSIELAEYTYTESIFVNLCYTLGEDMNDPPASEDDRRHTSQDRVDRRILVNYGVEDHGSLDRI